MGRKGGWTRARFTGIKIENSRFTGIKTDFSRITHNSAFDFHGLREINSFFHDSRQLKNRRSRFTENPLSDPRETIIAVKYMYLESSLGNMEKYVFLLDDLSCKK